MDIINAIASACNCSQADATEYLESEIKHLKELVMLDDFRPTDTAYACSSLGLDADWEIYFINALMN